MTTTLPMTETQTLYTLLLTMARMLPENRRESLLQAVRTGPLSSETEAELRSVFEQEAALRDHELTDIDSVIALQQKQANTEESYAEGEREDLVNQHRLVTDQIAGDAAIEGVRIQRDLDKSFEQDARSQESTEAAEIHQMLKGNAPQ